MSKKIVTEIAPELASMSALNMFMPNVHSSRGAMFTGNLGQFLLVNGATPRKIYGGLEREYGKATFTQGFDVDVQIIKVIPRYPEAGTRGYPIRSNPVTTVIYEEDDGKRIGVLNLTEFHSTHQHFGFRYKEDRDVMNKLTPGTGIEAGTVVRHSPNVLPNGNYTFGLETNVLFSSDPAVIEDGIKVSDSYLERIIPTGYGSLVVEFGKNYFPISLYGGPDEFKIMPNIGERISTDGLLVCLRKHDDITNVVNMNVNSICKPDHTFDRKKYAVPDAKVVDIRVTRNTSLHIPPMPVGTEEQLMRYWEADNSYYRKILDVYWGLRNGPLYRGKEMPCTPEFHSLVIEAIHRCGTDYYPIGENSGNGRSKREKLDVRSEYRGVPLDAWRVEIVYEHQSVPNTGFKLTDIDGGKGVIVSVVPEEDMPIDDNGNRVEVIMDDLSTTRRINPGRFYEQYINASARDTVKRMKEMMGYRLPDDATKGEVREFFEINAKSSVIGDAWGYLMGFYKIVSPIMHTTLEETYSADMNAIIGHLSSVCKDGVYIYFPINNPVHRPTMIRELRDRYPAIMTPVTYRGKRGNMVRTKQPMLIGSMYFMVLEKTAEDWSAVSSAKLQVYGTTARLNKFDKDSAPGRQNVVKTIGESESRSLAACIGGEEVADIMDATNNPLAHKAIYRNILTDQHPTNIEEVLDRVAIPKGGHRPRNYVSHILQCSGKKFTRD